METNAVHKVVCYGEVLWDILPAGALPGGAPMNVAYHLEKLGCNPALITRIGIDEWGKELLNGLAAQGVCTDYFYIDYETPTGLVYARPNEQNEVTYDIVSPSAWDYIDWHDEMAGLLQQAAYFVYGSLTSRSKTSRETLYRLLETAKTRVLDINLRAPHYQRNHVTTLLQSANILKMNLAELELITGWFSHYTDTSERIKLMQDQFNIPTIIVTMGGDGAMVVEDGQVYRHNGYKITVADTIGSGDSFLAGFLAKKLNGTGTAEALQFASATGAFIATQAGACPQYDVAQITHLIQNNPAASTFPHGE